MTLQQANTQLDVIAQRMRHWLMEWDEFHDAGIVDESLQRLSDAIDQYYREVAGETHLCQWRRHCHLLKGHDGPHRY